MILIKRVLFLLVAALTIASLLFLGVYGYSEYRGSGDWSVDELRLFSEQFLFIAIVLSCALLILFGIAFYSSIRLDKQLDKIIELNRVQDFSPERSMEKLGSMGKKITTLYQQLNTQNEKKTYKIGALTALTTFLVNNSDLPLVITDIGGTVLQINNTMVEKLSLSRADVIKKNIAVIFPEINVQNITFELVKYHASIEKKSSNHTLTCYPIYNRENELSYIVYVLEKKAIYKSPFAEQNGNKDHRPKNTVIQKALHRFFHRTPNDRS